MPPFYFLTFAKVSVSVSKKFGLKKVSVSVSKTFGLKKKSWYRSRKYLVSKKSLGLGLESFGLEKKSWYRSRWNFLVSSLSANQFLAFNWYLVPETAPTHTLHCEPKQWESFPPIPILIGCSENIGAIVATNPKNSKNYVASQSVRGGGREWKHPQRTFQSGPLARKILGVKKHKLLVKT